MARTGGAPQPTITDDRALGAADIQRSLRFNDDDSAYLNRTPSSASNKKTFTFSFWTKRGNLGGSNKHMFAIQIDSSNQFVIRFVDTDKLQIYDYQSSSHQMIFDTNALFRNVSAWYHIVVAVDTTQSTNTDRFKLYVNGSQVTSFSNSTYPSQNHDTIVNTTNAHYIGQKNSSLYFDGYLAEYNFIDGSQLDSSYFGFTDPVTNIWMPKRYEGTHGTNGFYLDFSDNSSTAALGIDKSTNGNDFTVSNLAVTDSVIDTPSNNFCTFINTGVLPQASASYSEGDLFFDESLLSGEPYDTHKTAYGTMSLKSGKWYWEGRATTIPGYNNNKWTYGVSDIENTKNAQLVTVNYLLAVSTGTPSNATYAYGDAVSIYKDDLYKNGTKVGDSYQTEPSAGDIIGVALDVDAGKVWFSRNGTWINGSASASTTLNPASHDTTVTTGEVYVPAFAAESCGWIANFGQDSSFAGNETAQGNKDEHGQGDFYYAVPRGFKTICSKNLPPNVPSIRPQRFFDTLLYTGNDSSDRNIEGLEFQPDFVWIKNRDQSDGHQWVDVVRGANNTLFSNSDVGESTNNSNGHVNYFTSGGFNVDAGAGGDVNENNEDYVAWCWKAGGAAVSNTDGSITSSCSANQEAGFSIITYTGTGSDGTIGHGLGAVPSIYFVKRRNSTKDWYVQIGNLSGVDLGRFLKLNETDGINFASDVFAATADTSTVLNTKSDSATNASGDTYVAYCWTEIPGFSKFGSYKGNGSADGPFLHLGFRPAFIMLKRYDTTNNWHIADSKRQNSYNPVTAQIYPNLSSAEVAQVDLDILSDGFKIRNSANFENASGGTYIYMAFAEATDATPFDTFPNAR